ncbi:MAG: DNA repair protein RecO [Thermodesulfovibrio sp.]|nr:DNA repair protein RecO [Thermodesulfovibrio sp.]
MIYSSEAIVLENKDYGEADLIVTYLTKEFGILDLFAKSPRKIRSKFGSSLEPLTYSKISFIGREDKLQKIIQSDIVYPFHKIRESYKIFLKLSEIIRWIIQFSPKKEKNPELFNLMLTVLKEIENSNKHENYILFFKIRILSILGYLPDIRYCGGCGKILNGDHYYLKGFIFCSNCLSKQGIEDRGDKILDQYIIPKGVMNFLNSFLKWQLIHLERVKINEKLMNQVESFIKKHISLTVKL